jgi:pyrroline-5-carboxylate reductase
MRSPMVLRNLALDKLLHEASTPGGIAATVMDSLDNNGYESILARGLRAGLKERASIRICFDRDAA